MIYYALQATILKKLNCCPDELPAVLLLDSSAECVRTSTFLIKESYHDRRASLDIFSRRY